jgi:hypothetical protein
MGHDAQTGPSRRTHDSLPASLWYARKDLLDLGLEAGVEHPVCLVKDEVGHPEKTSQSQRGKSRIVLQGAGPTCRARRPCR